MNIVLDDISGVLYGHKSFAYCPEQTYALSTFRIKYQQHRTLEGRPVTGCGFIGSSPHEIMVVDDNPAILELLSKLLKEKGYVVRSAIDGSIALKSVKARIPDLILLDVKMSNINGFDVCRKLKSEEYSRDIPIIFISALNDTEQVIEGFKAGGVDYITKPFHAEEVLARVKTHLNLRELTERLEQKVNERTAELTQVNLFLRNEIEKRRQTEHALQKAHHNLERMVDKRTAQLSIKNRQLVSEIEKHRLTEQALRNSENRLRYLSSRLLAAQEKERQRISLEIHDELGQNLAVLKLQLNALASRLRKDQGALKEEFKNILNFIDSIIEEMRRISRDLSPSIIQDLKLCRSLKWMLHDFNKHTGIHILKKMIDIDEIFGTRDQVIIYRIFQEALNNIRKHAEADHVKVLINKDSETLFISIEDDGKGFDLDEVWNRHVAERGLGIASLEERTRMLGGNFQLKTEKGMGTCLTLTIPLGSERD